MYSVVHGDGSNPARIMPMNLIYENWYLVPTGVGKEKAVRSKIDHISHYCSLCKKTRGSYIMSFVCLLLEHETCKVLISHA